MVTSTMHGQTLTDEQLSQYERDGFYIAAGLFGPHEVAEIRGAFDAQDRLGPQPGLHDMRFEPGDPLYAHPRMMHPHKHADKPVGPVALQYLLDARVERILRDLIGEEPIAAQTMFYFKPPGARGQALHQDNFYLRVYPGTCIAAWAAIDDADEENGGLFVVPGSHRLEVFCPEPADSSISISPFQVKPPPGYSVIEARLKAGDVLFFNGSVIHGSYHNRSATRMRRSFISHYVPASCVRLSNWYRPLYNFRGQTLDRDYTSDGGQCGGDVVSATKAPH